jgi:hypothetical protein
MYYFTLVGPKLGYASVIWNYITSSDANELESMQQKLAFFCFNCLFPHIHYSYAYALETLRHHSLFKFSLVLNSALLFFELLVFEFLLGIPETFLCSVSAIQVKIVLLDAPQQLMMFVGVLACLRPTPFLLIMFYEYNGNFLIIKI